MQEMYYPMPRSDCPSLGHRHRTRTSAKSFEGNSRIPLDSIAKILVSYFIPLLDGVACVPLREKCHREHFGFELARMEAEGVLPGRGCWKHVAQTEPLLEKPFATAQSAINHHYLS